jgi:hypothetical protein
MLVIIISKPEDPEKSVLEDIVLILRDIIAKESTNMAVVKLSTLSMKMIMSTYPAVKDQCKPILKELIESLQNVLKKQFEPELDPNQIDSGASLPVYLDSLVTSAKKFTSMISSVSFADLVNQEDIISWNQYIVKHVFALFGKQSFLNEATSTNIATLLQLPVECYK